MLGVSQLACQKGASGPTWFEIVLGLSQLACQKGVWAYVKGGMGGLSNAIASAARSHGAEVRTGVEVGRILVKSGAVYGVALANGDEVHARTVASNADANVTFNKLLDNRLH